MSQITETRIHLDNGFDYFFKDDVDFGFTSVRSAIQQGYELCVKLKSNVKVVLSTTYENRDYKDEVIARFDYRNIIKAEKHV